MWIYLGILYFLCFVCIFLCQFHTSIIGTSYKYCYLVIYSPTLLFLFEFILALCIFTCIRISLSVSLKKETCWYFDRDSIESVDKFERRRRLYYIEASNPRTWIISFYLLISFKISLCNIYSSL